VGFFGPNPHGPGPNPVGWAKLTPLGLTLLLFLNTFKELNIKEKVKKKKKKKKINKYKK